MPRILHSDLGEALNRAGIDASSELRKPEIIVFPLALQIPNQKEAAPLVSQPIKEAQSYHPPLTSQQEQGREQETLKDSSLDKVTEALQLGAASQDFEKKLASVTLSVEGSLKEKEKKIPPEVADQAPKSKLQIEFKPQFLYLFLG